MSFESKEKKTRPLQYISALTVTALLLKAEWTRAEPSAGNERKDILKSQETLSICTLRNCGQGSNAERPILKHSISQHRTLWQVGKRAGGGRAWDRLICGRCLCREKVVTFKGRRRAQGLLVVRGVRHRGLRLRGGGGEVKCGRRGRSFSRFRFGEVTELASANGGFG